MNQKEQIMKETTDKIIINFIKKRISIYKLYNVIYNKLICFILEELCPIMLKSFTLFVRDSSIHSEFILKHFAKTNI